MTPALLDIRHLQTPGGPPGACMKRGGKMLIRPLEDVDTILGHQTACFFGVHPSQVRAAGGDPLLAQFMRAKGVHAQVTAFDEGTYVAAYPLRAYVYHGNGGSGRSVGLEGEGLYNGRPGQGRAEPSDLLIETLRAACTFIVEDIAREGGAIKFYDAHRKHASSRRGDPGWRIWQAVYLAHCRDKLGLRLREGTTRDGLEIPEVWDPEARGVKY